MIVSVSPVEKVFSITWMLGKRCNYDCMYCPASSHDNSSEHKSLDDLKAIWLSIVEKTKHLNLPYKVSFTGGEVTANKNFLSLTEWMRSEFNMAKIVVTSNGSASTAYYQRLMKVVDNLSLSTHGEHIDEQRFFNTVIQLKQELKSDKFLHVNIMNEFWNAERIKQYEKILITNDVSYSVNEIDYSLKTRDNYIMKGNLNLEI